MCRGAGDQSDLGVSEMELLRQLRPPSVWGYRERGMRGRCGRREKGPLAHAVPDGAPCRWGGDEDRLQFLGTTLLVLTQWASFWLPPSSPTPKTPRFGQLSCN